MNMLKKVALAAALATGLLGSGAASAAEICSGCAYRFAGDGAAGLPGPVAASYIGLYNPTINLPGDPIGDLTIGFRHRGLATAFNDWWVFQISPAGNTEWDATFTPGLNVTAFNVALYSVTGLSVGSGTGATCSAVTGPGNNAVAGFCGTNGATSFISSAGVTAPGQLRLNSTLAAAGWYAFNVSGGIGISSTNNGYSGNLISSAIPEPGSLALVALGLLAAGAGLRRRA